MYILSSFTPEHLKSPLEYLLKNFYSNSLTLQYAETNLMIKISELANSEKKNQPVAIFFRLFEIIGFNEETITKINAINLKKTLDEFIDLIILFKNNRKDPLIVFLCPSLYKENILKDNYELKNNYEILKKYEAYFLNKMQENKIHTLSEDDIQSMYKQNNIINEIGCKTHIPYTEEYYVASAILLVRKLHCIEYGHKTQGCETKVVFVDCDRVLWDGVVGDVGPLSVQFKEHNIFVQEVLVKMANNGIFICLISKNEEKMVNDVFFYRNEEMPLKIGHVIIKKINRDLKSSNILAALSELKLLNAKNAMFIDDSPREIEEVSEKFPEIFCVLMPQTYEEVKNIWGFDIDKYVIATKTDQNRLKLVQQEVAIKTVLAEIPDPIVQLETKRKNLQTLSIGFIENAERSRVTQMAGRTNQFNIDPKNSEIDKDLEDLFKENFSEEKKEYELVGFKAVLLNKEVSRKQELVEDTVEGKESPRKKEFIEDLAAVAICKVFNDYLLVNHMFLSCRNAGMEIEYALIKHIANVYSALNTIKIKFKKTGLNGLAETFIDMLCDEADKKSSVRFLLRNTSKLSSQQNFMKNLFKNCKVLPKDYNKNIDEVIIFEFSANFLRQLDPYLLTRKTMNANAIDKNQPKKRVINKSDLANARTYLAEIQKKTQTTQPLLEKLFIGSKFKSIDNLSEKIIEKVKFLLFDRQENLSQNIFQKFSLVYLGLDSLKATSLSTSIYDDEKVVINISMLLNSETTVSVLVNYINQQKKQKNRIGENSIVYELDQNCLPVSLQEERIFCAEQSERVTNSSRFHMTACFLAFELNIDCLKNAYQRLIQHYDVFGYYFSIKNGQLIKSYILPENRKINFYYKEISEFALMSTIQEKIKEPLSMIDSNGLIRLFIFEDKVNKKYYIFFHIHHAIFDAVSLKNCLDTLSKLYQDSIIANFSKIIDCPPQYIEFIQHQQKKTEDEAYQKAAYNFWKNTLSKIEAVTTLPYDLTVSTFKPATEQIAKRYTFSLSPEDLLALKALAKSNDVTCFNVLNALFGLLIASYTYQKNITLITATNGRNEHPSFNKMVGFFVNLLIQQFDLEGNQRFDEYLKQVNKKFLASQEFQDFPFSKKQEILLKQGINDILSSPALIYQSYAIPELKLNEEIAQLELPQQPIIFDMRETCRFGHFTLFAQENQQELTFIIEYAQNLFRLSFIERFAKNFLHIIRGVCNNPNQSLQEISMVCDGERHQLISLGQGPKLVFSENDNLIRKFQQTVATYPDNIALCYNEYKLSYREVDTQSTQLAHVLIAKGVKQGNYVGIFLDANHLFFIAELAVLKIGAVFIPLSKADPSIRLKSIIKDANIQFFIINKKDLKKNQHDLIDTELEDSIQNSELISIDSTENFNLEGNLSPLLKSLEDRMCILYTSGSTGRPKGVILLEKGIFRVVESPKFVKVLPGDKIAQTANQVFDAAQFECWLAWNNGACLVLFDKETILNTSLLQSKLMAEKITHMWLTAGLFNMHANDKPELFGGLKYLIVGGDIVHKDIVLKVLTYKDSPIIINGYGPTETSIFALTYTFNKQELTKFFTSPIGTPINNTEVQILTPCGSLAPYGAIGELGIKGEGVARGYLSSSPLSENKRFRGDLKSREYLTGDLVRYDSDLIMFVDRANEQQIKVNGNLVSLEEVRFCFSQHPFIKQVEIIIKNIDGFNKLIAFYILKEKATKPTNQEFRDFLNKRLPSYMVPAFYCQRDNFLTNSNGKLDKSQFDHYELQVSDNIKFRKLEGDEKQILKIFKKVLSCFPDNIEADFFEWGGSSLQAVLLVNKINDFFKDMSICTNDLYANSTVEGLTSFIKKNKSVEKTNLRLLKKGDSKFPAIIFIHPAGGGVSCFNKLLDTVEFNNPCYGIEDPLLQKGELKLLSMEKMASNYLAIIADELIGPFILSGYSFGGMLALEMAVQYETKSENKLLLEVVLFDTWIVSSASMRIQSELKKEVLTYCSNQREKANIDGSLSQLMPVLEQLCEHHQTTGFNFFPNKLNETPVFLLKANNVGDIFSKMTLSTKDNFVKQFVNSDLFQKIEIDATHYDMLDKSDTNSLSANFSMNINSINEKIIFKSNREKIVDARFFASPLRPIHNDSSIAGNLKLNH
ncbi:MAG: HAD-IIIC family phosphatase [Candidatus Aquirickettsiella sp.]